MKKLWFCILCIFLVAFGGMMLRPRLPEGPGSGQPAKPDPITEKIAAMTPEEKAGQLMLVGLEGRTPSEAFQQEMKDHPYGGVILFDRNMENPAQVKALTGRLQDLSGDIPLFIGLDEEGGQVARMKDTLPAPPSQAAIGATGNPDMAQKWAAETGRQLKQLGINLNLAPVADVGSGAGRSYSSHPATAAKFVERALDGYQQVHLMACVKHFPGLGKGQEDTHKGRVTVSASRETLEREDLLPFREALEKFPEPRFAMMVTHVDYPALDPDWPASLSRKVMGDLLRNRLHFDGIIMTDDLTMGAIAGSWPLEEAAVRALGAGADQVMVCHDPEAIRKVHQAIAAAIREGKLPKDQVDRSLYRILKTKESL